MIRTLTVLLILVLTSSKLSAQVVNQKGYLSLEDNIAWLESFKKLDSKGLQLKAIQEKIYSDSLYVAPRPGVSYSFLSNESRKRLKVKQDSLPTVNSDCKIIMVLNSDEDQTFLDLKKNPNSTALVKQLKPENIDTINILEGTAAKAFYGARTRGCPVLVLKAVSGKLPLKSKETTH